VKCDIYNSKGIHVGLVIGPAIFDLTGKLLYELKGTKIYRTSGELVGHLHDASGSETLRLDPRSSDASRLWMQCLFVCFQSCNHNFDAI
jgi:sporulation protein YlmC with PRC-barrel domain